MTFNKCKKFLKLSMEKQVFTVEKKNYAMSGIIIDNTSETDIEHIQKYKDEEGTYPESVAIYWMTTDIMWADGEGMAQLLYLLGVEPVWLSNGKVKHFKIIEGVENEVK